MSPISDVNQATGDMSHSYTQVNLNAKDPGILAEDLKQMVGRFKL